MNLRRLTTFFPRLLGAKTSTLRGLTLITDPARVSRQVRAGIFKGDYEAPEQELAALAIRPGDKVLEIGGGVGFVSMVCARLAGPGRVLTYEANPAMQALIRDNFALNGMAPDLRARAITVAGGPVPFFVADNIISSSMYRREQGGMATVESDALDQVIAEWAPDVLVMDVEGAEVDILPTSRLPGIRAIVLELHPHVTGDEPVARLRAHLRAQGFVERRSVLKSILLVRE